MFAQSLICDMLTNGIKYVHGFWRWKKRTKALSEGFELQTQSISQTVMVPTPSPLSDEQLY